MAHPVETTPNPRWHYVFEESSSFGQDVDVIGRVLHAVDAWQAWGAEPEQAADYGFRRVLAALVEAGQLRFPFEISAFPVRDRFAEYAIFAGETRNLRLWIAGDPDTDESLLKRSRHGLGEVSDVVIFIDRDGPSAGSSIPAFVQHEGAESPSAARNIGGFHLLTTRQAQLFSQTERETSVPLDKLYATDYFGWLMHQSFKLENINITGIDSENLSEEVGDMGKREKRQVQSYLETILLHLLKWEMQTGWRSSSWETSIENSRENLLECLNESRKLYGELEAEFEKIYKRGRHRAIQETGLSEGCFPQGSPYDLKQALDRGFLPEGDKPSWAPAANKESDQ